MRTQAGKSIAFATIVAGLVCAGTLAMTSRASAQVPLALSPPAGNVETLRWYGVGVQIYTSVSDGAGGFVWKFVAPEATLYNNGGHAIGKHFAGPTWESNNGSEVVGSKIASVASPLPATVPWLLLQAVSHDGNGMFSDVSYIQRLDTEGGAAPSVAPTEAGLVARVPYTATYVFFEPDSE